MPLKTGSVIIKHSLIPFHYPVFHWIFVFTENWVNHIKHKLLISSVISCYRTTEESVTSINVQM